MTGGVPKASVSPGMDYGRIVSCLTLIKAARRGIDDQAEVRQSTSDGAGEPAQSWTMHRY
jgi:hypothetical protein